MVNFVVQHALANVWCAPALNKRVTIAPVKITPTGGASAFAKVLWEMVPLPTSGVGDFYHVYQIGQVNAAIYNLPTTQLTWMNAGDLCVSQSMVIHAYTEKGIQYPLGNIYFRINDDLNLIVAVRVIPGYPVNLDAEPIWLNLLSNQFFRTAEWAAMKLAATKPNAIPIQYIYYPNIDAGEITAFQTAVNTMLAATVGTNQNVLYYRNGRLSSWKTNGNSINVGDYVEAIVDGSIASIQYYPLPSMQSFVSTLDSSTKRLFPPTTDYSTINYKDDIDFYMVSSNTSPILQYGLYLNQDVVSNLRMVTHNSYSVSDVMLQGLLAQDPMFHVESDVAVAAIIRNGAFYGRSLLATFDLLSELYKLPLPSIIAALVGTSATIPEWTAASLENSDYMAVMQARTFDQVTESMVENAYGYGLMTRTFCNPYPALVVGASQVNYILPPGLLASGATAYGSTGEMIGTSNSSAGVLQVVPEPLADIANIELSPGVINAPYQNNLWYGCPVVSVTTSLLLTGFRCYACPIDGNNNPTEAWVDVTDTNFYSVSSDGLTLTWNMAELALLHYYPAVKVGGELLYYHVPLATNSYSGYLAFNITANIRSVLAGTTDPSVPALLENRTVRIPYGTLDLFMDGFSLIEGTDYFVNWPQVCIVKPPARTPVQGLDVVVRAYGFCKPDMTREGPRETGFVVDSVLSVNAHRDIRDDRNYRIVVGGLMQLPNQVMFDESGPILTINPSLDGQPYSISDIVMPVEAFTNQSTLAYRALSVDMETRVGNYMSLINPGTPALSINPILNPYMLVSPFCSAIVHMFINDNWLAVELTQPYDNLDIAGWVAPITGLLQYDPCLNLNLDMRYLYIAPHQYDYAIGLTQAQYAFLQRVIQDYLSPPGVPPRLNLTNYITIIL